MLAIQFYFVVIILGVGVFSTTPTTLSEKDTIRDEFKRSIGTMINRVDLVDGCSAPINAEQQRFAHEKIEEFLQCLTSTVDILFDRFDANVTKADFQDTTKGYKFIPQMCDMFGETFKCFLEFDPFLALCSTSAQNQTKRNIFTLAPIIHNSVCLQNGTVLSKLAANHIAVRCGYITYDWLMANGLHDLLLSPTNTLFGSARECGEFKRLQSEFISQIFDCSDREVFDLFKPVVGTFCRQTKCHQFDSDLQCLE